MASGKADLLQTFDHDDHGSSDAEKPDAESHEVLIDALTLLQSLGFENQFGGNGAEPDDDRYGRDQDNRVAHEKGELLDSADDEELHVNQIFENSRENDDRNRAQQKDQAFVKGVPVSEKRV